jgi:hypothetical protein
VGVHVNPNYERERTMTTKQHKYPNFKKLVEGLDEYFGTPYGVVFNNHVNDAHERAKRVMKLVCEWNLKEIEEAEEEGILSIFDSGEPTEATMTYVSLVAAFVLEA